MAQWQLGQERPVYCWAELEVVVTEPDLHIRSHQGQQSVEPKVDSASSTDWHRQHPDDVAAGAMWVPKGPEPQCHRSNGMRNPDNSTLSSCFFFRRDKSKATTSSLLESHEGAHNRSSDEHGA